MVTFIGEYPSTSSFVSGRLAALQEAGLGSRLLEGLRATGIGVGHFEDLQAPATIDAFVRDNFLRDRLSRALSYAGSPGMPTVPLPEERKPSSFRIGPLWEGPLPPLQRLEGSLSSIGDGEGPSPFCWRDRLVEKGLAVPLDETSYTNALGWYASLLGVKIVPEGSSLETLDPSLLGFEEVWPGHSLVRKRFLREARPKAGDLLTFDWPFFSAAAVIAAVDEEGEPVATLFPLGGEMLLSHYDTVGDGPFLWRPTWAPPEYVVAPQPRNDTPQVNLQELSDMAHLERVIALHEPKFTFLPSRPFRERSSLYGDSALWPMRSYHWTSFFVYDRHHGGRLHVERRFSKKGEKRLVLTVDYFSFPESDKKTVTSHLCAAAEEMGFAGLRLIWKRPTAEKSSVSIRFKRGRIA